MSDLIDRKASNLNAALRPQDRQRTLKIGWTSSGCGFDDTKRAVAELQRCHGRVFSFDFRQGRNRAPVNAHNVSKEPFQHIDVMAGLVSQNATIASPSAAPSILIVII